MSMGDVFAKAYELWKRDVGWLILAGLVVGVIMAAILGVAIAVFVAIFAAAGVTIGADLASNSSDALGALGLTMILVGILLYIVVLFVVQVVAMVFYGGMFEMVIGAARGNRGVRFGDLFSGFRKFGAYTLYALVMMGISFATNLLQVIPFIGAIIALVISLWIGVIWLYVLPLIADHGMAFSAAAKRSFEMVKSVGWWRTFGMLVVLGLAIVAALIVIVLVAVLIGKGSEWAGIAVGLVLFLVFAVLVPPYSICYVSVMYLGSGGAAESVAGPTYVPAPLPPAPMPPAPGQMYGAPGQVYGAPPLAAPPVPPPPPAPPHSSPDAARVDVDEGFLQPAVSDRAAASQFLRTLPPPPAPPAFASLSRFAALATLADDIEFSEVDVASAAGAALCVAPPSAGRGASVRGRGAAGEGPSSRASGSGFVAVVRAAPASRVATAVTAPRPRAAASERRATGRAAAAGGHAAPSGRAVPVDIVNPHVSRRALRRRRRRRRPAAAQPSSPYRLVAG